MCIFFLNMQHTALHNYKTINFVMCNVNIFYAVVIQLRIDFHKDHNAAGVHHFCWCLIASGSN